ncbi:hypothetical protein ACHAXM_005942 [Skeletonema potamos]
MHPKNLEARIEILTDGSDNAGAAAAVFLTIRRCCSHVHQCPDSDDPSPSSDGHYDCYYQESPQDLDDGTIVARYNLSGIPSLVGRLSSDQSYKLLQNGAFSAVLIPSLVKSFGCDGGIMRGECISGLPALFLNLIQAGYKIAGVGDNDNKKKLDCTEYSFDSGIDCDRTGFLDTSYNDVSIVGPAELNNIIDGLLETMFGNSGRHPSLRLCEVPHGDEQWYEVYEDSYVCIWAQSIPHHGTSATTLLCKTCTSDTKYSDAARKDGLEECSLAFIVTLRSHTHKNEHQFDTKRQRTTLRPVHSRPYSFAIMPQPTSSFHCKGTCQKCGTIICNSNFRVWDVFRNLPQEIVSGRNESSFLLDFILHLNPLTGEKIYDCKKNPGVGNKTIDAIRVEKRRIYVPSWMVEAKLAHHHLALFPSDTPDNEHADNGLLIRAWHRSKVLHDALPFAFPLNTQKSIEQKPQNLDNTQEHVGGVSFANALKLSSCTSVTLNGWGSTHYHSSFTFLSRSEAIRSRCHERSFTNWNEISQGDNTKYKRDFTEMVDSLKCAYSGETCYCNGCVGMQQQKMEDDNEIDLDDSSCEYEDLEHLTKEGGAADRDISIATIDVKSAHLLFLGTGCATPSPCRGSSGIGLFMPTSTYESDKFSYRDELWLSAIIDCGEGTLNSLARRIKCFSCEQSSLDYQLSRVNFIWISHAHLDHYGDLSSVVQAVANAKRKLHKSRPVVVIAPHKVLKYLSVMLLSHAPKAEDRHFIGVTHRDFQTSPFAGHVRSMIYDHKLVISSQLEGGRQTANYYNPFVSIQNVEVEHCRDAYALLLELCIPTKSGVFDRFVLCFSGDTRPSALLTKACVMYSTSVQREQPFPISLLIHEATFLDDPHGREDALRKRHSTVREALDVATSIRAEGCLLTHFSQRYSHVSANDVRSGDGSNSYPGSWGVANDGMLIPLTKRGMAALIPLTKCIDAIFSSPDTKEVG